MSLFIGMIFSPIQMLIVAVVVLLLFGHRLPSTMRSLGKGVTEFKKGLQEGDDETPSQIEDKTAGTRV